MTEPEVHPTLVPKALAEALTLIVQEAADEAEKAVKEALRSIHYSHADTARAGHDAVLEVFGRHQFRIEE